MSSINLCKYSLALHCVHIRLSEGRAFFSFCRNYSALCHIHEHLCGEIEGWLFLKKFWPLNNPWNSVKHSVYIPESNLSQSFYGKLEIQPSFSLSPSLPSDVVQPDRVSRNNQWGSGSNRERNWERSLAGNSGGATEGGQAEHTTWGEQHWKWNHFLLWQSVCLH